MKKLFYIAFLLGFMGVISSCSWLHEVNKQDEPEIEMSPVYPLSGQWWVVYRFDDGSGVVDDYYGVGHTTLYTYNTANNDVDRLWISDGGHLGSGSANFWSYCVKSPCNVGSRTFEGDSLVSTADGGGAPYPIKVNVTNGKVIVDGGKSLSGVVTDSIYMELEFEDDPGVIYQCSGVRRTGFPEDEH